MWFYRDEHFTSEKIENFIGCVYLITNLSSGKKYVGQKRFIRLVRKGKAKRRTKVESDWLKYWGSNKILQEEVKTLGEEHFRREILHLCTSKGEMNYRELKEQMDREVLLKPSEYYNEFMGGKIHRKHLSSLICSS